jgi:hypothetical protein
LKYAKNDAGEHMEILTFTIDGRVEVTSTKPDDDADKSFSLALNIKADEIASTMEREIRRLMLLGGGVTVQADLWFRPGASVILEGSVILLCWAGRTALEPIREELANAIKIVTRRVLNRVISTMVNYNFAAPTTDVTSLPPTRSETTPAPTAVPPPQQQVAPTGTIIQDQRWLIIVVAVLGVLVLILLADRLLSSSLPRNVSVTPAISALPTVTPTPTAPTTAAPK